MKHKTSDNTNHPADELKNEIHVYKINSIHGLLTRPARFSVKNFCGLLAPCGRGFGFAQLKRSAGTHFPQHTSPSLLRSHSRGALWKECSKPGGDAKSPWTARSIPQSPLSSRISPCASPASLLLHRKILFAQNLGIVPTTDSFTHPLPLWHKPACNSFPPHAPPKSLRWFGTQGLRPCKTATPLSDTIRHSVCSAPFLAPSSHYGTNCPAFSCHTSCIQ